MSDGRKRGRLKQREVPTVYSSRQNNIYVQQPCNSRQTLLDIYPSRRFSLHSLHAPAPALVASRSLVAASRPLTATLAAAPDTAPAAPPP